MAGKWTRRAIAVGAVAAGAAVVAGSRLIPMGFVKQYWAERGRPVAMPPKQVDISNWTDRGVHAAWLGHSTVLLKIDGITVLTDPILSEYAGIGIGPITVGVKRLVNTPMVLTSLPKNWGSRSSSVEAMSSSRVKGSSTPRVSTAKSLVGCANSHYALASLSE